MALALVIGVAACSSSGSDEAGRSDGTTAPTTAAPVGSGSTVPPTTTAASTLPSTTVAATTAPVTVPAEPDPTTWLCHPDLSDDPCDEVAAVTEVRADGTEQARPVSISSDPAIDCFYVYPTVSSDEGVSSDLVPQAESVVATLQAARFSETCRVFAPMYRSVTVGGLTGLLGGGGDAAAAFGQASADVEAAWTSYLERYNNGRGVILVSHSQGTFHLIRLIREVIDPAPEQRDLVVSAMLVGGSFQVPDGADVGGDAKNLPLCRSEEQVGCIITYSTYRPTDPPRPGALFGAPGNGTVAGCTNPASLAGGAAALGSAFASQAWLRDDGAVPATERMAAPGLITGECRSEGDYRYLAITVGTDPADQRTDTIPGDGFPNWGLHTIDMDLAYLDLVRIAQTQAVVWAAR
jgi:hypothetical protein